MAGTFWKSDRFLGLAVSGVFVIAWLLNVPLLQRLEGDAYDLGMRMSSRDSEPWAMALAAGPAS